MIDGDAGEVMEMHGDDYLDMEEEFEPVEGCNCIYCRMARMEKSMAEIEQVIGELKGFLELYRENLESDEKPAEKSRT